MALAFKGTVLIATGGGLTTLTLPLAGLMWGLGDALASATMSILPVKVMGRYGNFTVNGLMFLISGVILWRGRAAVGRTRRSWTRWVSD